MNFNENGIQSMNLSNVYYSKMVPNIQIELSSKRLLTIDEVEKVQCQWVASLIGHMF